MSDFDDDYVHAEEKLILKLIIKTVMDLSKAYPGMKLKELSVFISAIVVILKHSNNNIMKLTDRDNKKIKHKELIKLYAQKMNCSEANAEKYLNGFIEIIFEAIKEKSSVTINNFGNFYVSEKTDSTAFKFNPSQKMKAALGWSSNYKEES